ncbi:uncharacterized protein BDV17DRAFT_282803 [Aspergillus undulatus]|uniref:uncharacterized protein n=1 Tax=Aspergillus undulatus TaxID=1810928 RepID=UPI003CCCFC77
MGLFFCPKLRNYREASDHEHPHALVAQESPSSFQNVELGSFRGRPSKQGYTTSADSLASCPPQLSVRKRHQRPRKEITQGEQSIHLGEMNIRGILASSGSTPRLEPQDQLPDENRTSGYTGTWNSSRYPNNNPTAMPPILDAPEVRSPPMMPASIQDPRSPYSPKSTISSADLDEQNIPNFGQGSSSNTPSRRPYLSSNHASASAVADIETNAPKSKFIERFGSNRSVGPAGVESPDGDNSATSRRISIGWMTDGRRIGYGYELVPPDNSMENHVRTHSESTLTGERGLPEDSPKGSPAGNIAGDTEKQKPPLAEEASQPPPKTRESSFDISAIFQKFNLQRWAGANFALRTSNNSDAASCDSGGSSLFGILTNKKKPIGEAGPNADGEDPWEFCSWVRPRQSSGGQQAPSQDTVQSREYTEAQLTDRPANFRRRRGTLATKRKVSEIARNLEKRADQAVDRFPAVRRTATRVLRLREPGRKERRRGMHVSDPEFPGNQFDGLSDVQGRRSERLSSGSSGWDSLYEECLDSLECSIPE